MGLRHGILVIARAHDVGVTLGSWLEKAGYDVRIASTFAEGKQLLDAGPDLVVSELKLGEYNGLHLAARASNLGIPAIVLGPGDLGLERDAHDLGAPYVPSTIQREDLLAIVASELNAYQSHLTRTGAGCVQERRVAMLSLPGRSLVTV